MLIETLLQLYCCEYMCVHFIFGYLWTPFFLRMSADSSEKRKEMNFRYFLLLLILWVGNYIFQFRYFSSIPPHPFWIFQFKYLLIIFGMLWNEIMNFSKKCWLIKLGAFKNFENFLWRKFQNFIRVNYKVCEIIQEVWLPKNAGTNRILLLFEELIELSTWTS